jgi:diguanylate cyclase (GGDEF)-like protein
LFIIVGFIVINIREIGSPLALTHEATHDKLTGLLNHAGLKAELNSMFNSAYSQKQNHALCCLTIHNLADVSRFQSGAHHALVVKTIAACIAGRVRSGDIIARVRDDGFVVLAHSCDLAQAKDIAVQLERAVADCNIAVPETAPSLHAVTAVTLFDATSGTVSSVLDILALACQRDAEESTAHQADSSSSRTPGND